MGVPIFTVNVIYSQTVIDLLHFLVHIHVFLEYSAVSAPGDKEFDYFDSFGLLDGSEDGIGCENESIICEIPLFSKGRQKKGENNYQRRYEIHII